MSLELGFGIGLLLPEPLPIQGTFNGEVQRLTRTDVLFEIARRAQDLSLVDLEINDWLEEGQERAWPGPEDATWYTAAMPDILGPIKTPDGPDLRQKWAGLRARPGLTVEYPRGALVLPMIQGAGALAGFFEPYEFLERLWCMPLYVLRDLVELDAASVEELVQDCFNARVPVCVAPTRGSQE